MGQVRYKRDLAGQNTKITEAILIFRDSGEKKAAHFVGPTVPRVTETCFWNEKLQLIFKIDAESTQNCRNSRQLDKHMQQNKTKQETHQNNNYLTTMYKNKLEIDEKFKDKT